MPAEFAAGARFDLLEAASFYRAESVPLAASFLTEVDQALELLQAQPRIGTPLRGGFRGLVLRRFPYTLIYRVEPNGLYVVAVAHQRRRPGYWRRRK